MSLLPIQYPSISPAAAYKRMQALRELFTPTSFTSDLTAPPPQSLGPWTEPNALRTLFGNAHLFESDLASLAQPLATYSASMDARELVRDIAKSYAFRSRFFEAASNTRFIELAFKFFLGRSPADQPEAAKALAVLNVEGYDAVVDWFVDSEEYAHKFGASLIPRMGAWGEYMGGMPAFSATMRLQLPTRGGDSDVTCSNAQTMNVLAGGNPAGVVEIRKGYDVCVPRYEKMEWMQLPMSVLLKDWSAVSMVMTDAVDSWSGLGTPRPTGTAEGEWESGWKPEAVGEQWKPGWVATTKKYV